MSFTCSDGSLVTRGFVAPTKKERLAMEKAARAQERARKALEKKELKALTKVALLRRLKATEEQVQRLLDRLEDQ